MKKMFLLLSGLLLLIGLAILLPRDEPVPAVDAPAYSTFLSPGDGRFKVAVHGRHTPWSWLTDRIVMHAPGSGGDGPAMVYLYDTHTGKMLHSTPAEMMNGVNVRWFPNQVVIDLFVEWDLPP